MGILFLTCVFLHGNDEKRGDLNQILMYGISYWLLLQRKCILSINEASRHGLAAYPGGKRRGRAVSCKDAPTVSCQRVSLVSRRTSTNRPRRASGDAPRGGRFLQNESGCHGSSCSMQRMEDDMMKWRKLISWNRKTGTGMSPMNPAAIPAGFEGHSIKSIPIYRAGSSLHFPSRGRRRGRENLSQGWAAKVPATHLKKDFLRLRKSFLHGGSFESLHMRFSYFVNIAHSNTLTKESCYY